MHYAAQLNLLDGHVLHLDATGSILQKPDQCKSQSDLLICSAVISTQNTVVSISDFVSIKTRTTDITIWLIHLINNLKDVKKISKWNNRGPYLPKYVVVDFSWPFIHAALLVFNRCDVLDYIDQMHQLLTKTGKGPRCRIVICVCHFVNLVSKNTPVSKRNKKFFLRSFLAMLKCGTLIEMQQIWKDMIVIFGAHNVNPVGTLTMVRMEKLTSGIEYEVEVDQVADQTIKMSDEDEQEEKDLVNTLRSNSVFTKEFEKFKIDETEELPRNIYYEGEALKKLQQTWLGLIALYCQPELDNNLSNAEVETFFRWLKDCMKSGSSGGRRLSVSNFVGRYIQLTRLIF